MLYAKLATVLIRTG